MNDKATAKAVSRLVEGVGAKKGKDTVPAYLTAGEYVLPKATVEAMGGSKALDRLVSATNDKKPGGKPVARSTKPFKPRNAHERMTGFSSGGMVNPMADAQADHQRWLEAGGVTGENVDPSVYGFANGGSVRKMKSIDPSAVQPVPDVGGYWSDSNAAFEAGNPSALDRVGRAVNPVTGLGSALGAMHDAAGQGDVAGMGLAAAGAVPAFGVARLASIPGKGLVKSTQAMIPSAKHTGAAVAGNAAFGAAADTYVPGQENGTAQPIAQRQNVALPNTTAKDQRRYAGEVMGYAAGGAVRRMVTGYYDGGEVERKDPLAPVSTTAGGTSAASAAPALKPVGAAPLEAKSSLSQSPSGAERRMTAPTSSTGVPTPTSGSYEAQRNYARQTGAMNIPAPAPAVKPPPLPSSSTLAPGSAAWSRSYAGEQQQKQQGAMARMTEDSGQSTIKPTALPSSATQAQSGAMNRMTALGGVRRLDETAPSIKSRAVEGAPGVRRYDQPGQSPLYSNVADPWDDKGGISTIPSQHMQNPAGAVSRMVGPALQSAANRGDFRAVRQHYQRGNGVFGGETSEQTALRRLTEPSGSVKIGSQAKIDAEREQGRIDSKAGEVERLVKSGNYKGASVLQREVDGMRNVAGAGLRRESERQAQADAERAGRVSDLRTAVQQQEQAPAARTDLQIKQASLAEQERKNELLSRITGTDRDEAVKALDLYRQLYSGDKQQPTQMSYVGTKDPVSGLEERTPVAFDPNTGAWQKMPVATQNRPDIGAVMDGYKYNGGDPADMKNWSKVG